MSRQATPRPALHTLCKKKTLVDSNFQKLLNFHAYEKLMPTKTIKKLWYRVSEKNTGGSHDQADPRDGKKLTFQAIHLQFFVIDIVSISLGKPKTGFGIS
jgi:hypothetical protein